MSSLNSPAANSVTLQTDASPCDHQWGECKMAETTIWDVALDIARRDLLDLWRAKMLLFFFILFPILLMSMFGYIYPPVPKSNPNTGIIGTAFPNLPVSLVQMDDGKTANLITAQFIQISHQQGLFTVSESRQLPIRPKPTCTGKSQRDHHHTARFQRRFSRWTTRHRSGDCRRNEPNYRLCRSIRNLSRL